MMYGIHALGFVSLPNGVITFLAPHRRMFGVSNATKTSLGQAIPVLGVDQLFCEVDHFLSTYYHNTYEFPRSDSKHSPSSLLLNHWINV